MDINKAIGNIDQLFKQIDSMPPPKPLYPTLMEDWRLVKSSINKINLVPLTDEEICKVLGDCKGLLGKYCAFFKNCPYLCDGKKVAEAQRKKDMEVRG
jgi:hypothetical protein